MSARPERQSSLSDSHRHVLGRALITCSKHLLCSLLLSGCAPLFCQHAYHHLQRGFLRGPRVVASLIGCARRRCLGKLALAPTVLFAAGALFLILPMDRLPGACACDTGAACPSLCSTHAPPACPDAATFAELALSTTRDLSIVRSRSSSSAPGPASYVSASRGQRALKRLSSKDRRTLGGRA